MEKVIIEGFDYPSSAVTGDKVRITISAYHTNAADSWISVVGAYSDTIHKDTPGEIPSTQMNFVPKEQKLAPNMIQEFVAEFKMPDTQESLQIAFFVYFWTSGMPLWEHTHFLKRVINANGNENGNGNGNGNGLPAPGPSQKCPYCPAAFYTKAELNSHIKTQHPTEQPLPSTWDDVPWDKVILYGSIGVATIAAVAFVMSRRKRK